MSNPTPSENKTPEHLSYQHFDYMYLEKYELEARKLRAQAFAKGVSMLGRSIAKISRHLAKSLQSGFSNLKKSGLNTEINGKPGRFA